MTCKECPNPARGAKTGLCLVCYSRTYQRKYRSTPNGKAYHKNYTRSAAGKEASKRYRNSDKGKALEISFTSRYNTAKAQAKWRGINFNLSKS